MQKSETEVKKNKPSKEEAMKSFKEIYQKNREDKKEKNDKIQYRQLAGNVQKHS